MTRRRMILGAGTIGALGTAAVAIGFALEPRQAAFSYLTAWVFAISIALGALIQLMLGHATGARWMIVFRRFTEAIVATLPVLALLFVPIVLSLGQLYPWVDPPRDLAREALERLAHKSPYLNGTFFVIRAAVFLIAWTVIGELLTSWSARRARDPDRLTPRLRALSAGAMPFLALTLTFAAFDWLMSLTPLWYSTIYGLLYFSGGFVGALSLIAVIARAARTSPVVERSIRPSHTGALGRLLFAFLVFWAYMEFSQGIIIWIANKPDEVPWYIARGAGVWGGVFTVLVVGHFALPFFALLSRSLKRRPTLLAIVAGWLVVMHYVDVYWLVMPVLHRSFALHWLDVAAPCAVLGIVTCAALLRTRERPVIAEDDPDFATAVAYEGS